jgi:trehalose 6-phosphate synthase/phosphatase
MAEKLLFVSNRLPVTIEKKRGRLNYKQSMGGLATGLGSFYQDYESLWIGWGGVTSESLTSEEKEEIQHTLLKKYKNHAIWLSKKDMKLFYYGFCNRTIWPLFHYFPNYTTYDKGMWRAYEKVNRLFADTVIQYANPHDTIWIHDYQLLLLPKLIQEKLPDTKIGFFLHIPFPSFEIFRLLPWRNEIIEGMMGADLVGFHTYDYVRHFLSSVSRLLGYEHTLGQILIDNRVVKVDAFPMGIDFNRYAQAPAEKDTKEEIQRLKKRTSGTKVILSVDRLDYSKGILHRLQAYEHFLRTYPAYREKVMLILVAVPSRTGVDTYKSLKIELDELVGRINGEFATMDWMPVWYLYQSLPFHKLTALYFISDIALITPLRDGMNLIAKEYIATKGKHGGMLILSGMAGAVHELGEAIIVNPNNREQVAASIKEALEMPADEQKARNEVMQSRLKRYHVVRWAVDFMERLQSVSDYREELSARRVSPAIEKRIVQDYERAKKRLLLLDYDGTLIPFSKKPEQARPDGEVMSILKRLAEKEGNELIIISGRDKDSITNWFGKLPIGFIAEHGVWLRERGGTWSEMEHVREDWKEEIRSVLELYVDRTPGSFIEEKDYSLVWHYRRADQEFAHMRVAELKELLMKLTESFDLGISEGKKALEIKNSGITKGRAALHWISKQEWDFMLAVGDDLTDEDVFEVLPENAYSIIIGVGISKARYNIPSVAKLRALLQKIAG